MSVTKFRPNSPEPKKNRMFDAMHHAWEFKFLDVVNALSAFFADKQLNPFATAVWLDVFSVLQHNVQEMQFEWLDTTFMEAIESIGNVMILQPWSNPLPLRRSWCIYEVYAAHVTGSTFEIALSPSDAANFMAELRNHGADRFNEILKNTSCTHSQTSKPSDREAILGVIGATIGFAQLDQAVFTTLSQ
ncbi:Kinesin light chain 3 [Podochytrium sp. JEL0797]|nr:Kinesin light chain 3 [Podochytrium sp. JEL0797]